jgi:CsoR family transcriptional regulator, copper-sensing transcriptional repressor
MKARPGDKAAILARLSRIEGQVRGVQRMVEEDRYCVDVLTQVSAIHESLRKASAVLLRDHLRHCVTTAVTSGDPRRADKIYDELADLFHKYAR